MSDEPTWTDYYDEQGDRGPRELLLDVLRAFGEAGSEAVDLGCGQGIDTLALLERGWRVFAVDAEPEGIRRLRERVPSRLAGALRAEVASMEDVALPTADLVWASFSLFFCPPDRFAVLWAKVRDAVRPGGRFAGQLLGDRDTWASKSEISAFARADAERLLDGLEIERFEEEEEDGEACSGPKHWHLFHVVARRPS
ncbi:MAG: methyltransferase domain-containing protein [Actinobacteria bacterium]|nr:methyltransferase domain-containing protein [Actinomycetota bacterium]